MAFSFNANAQLRKIAGLKGVEGRFGYSGSGFSMAGAYSKYVKNGNYYKVGGEYTYELVDNYFVNSVLMHVNFNFNVFDLKDTFFFHLNLGAVGGYEMIEKTEFVLSTNSFVYGPAAGGEIEFYLTDKMVLIAGGEQRYILGSTIGNFNYRLHGGLKYIF